MNSGYTSQFYASIAAGSRRSALRVLPLVFDMVRPASVVDVGCGVGAWLNVARQLGAGDVVGIDGSHVDPQQLEIERDRFVGADLASASPDSIFRSSALVARTFDMAISLEVAEHLPPESARRFVDVLCALAPVVLFSAAIPHQGGTHHVNERFPSFWVPHFARHNYLPVDSIRKVVWDDASVEWWYRQNIMIFASAQAIQSTQRLSEARAATNDNALDLVHPVHYQRVVDWALKGWSQARSS